jgi:hypothetical protein
LLGTQARGLPAARPVLGRDAQGSGWGAGEISTK